MLDHRDGSLSTADGVVGIVEAIERTRELELDVLAHLELESCSPAARVLWAKAGELPPPRPVRVTRQARRASDNRTSDLLAIAPDGRRLLVESKVADGAFEGGQAEGYRLEAQQVGVSAVVVAPRAFLERMSAVEVVCFNGVVAVEELADALEGAAAGLEAPDDEVRASWLSRAAMYRAFARRAPGGHPDDEVKAFADAYRELAMARTGGRVQLNRESMENTGAYFAGFADDHPAPRPLALQHKLTFGQLDLRVPKWTATTLEAHLEALPDERKPPARWSVGLPRRARRDKSTLEMTPVLRYSLPTIDWPPPAFEDAKPVVVEALLAADALGVWLRDGGAEILTSGPSRATLDTLLAAARVLAESLDLPSIASSVDETRGM